MRALFGPSNSTFNFTASSASVLLEARFPPLPNVLCFPSFARLSLVFPICHFPSAHAGHQSARALLASRVVCYSGVLVAVGSAAACLPAHCATSSSSSAPSLCCRPCLSCVWQQHGPEAPLNAPAPYQTPASRPVRQYQCHRLLCIKRCVSLPRTYEVYQRDAAPHTFLFACRGF